MAGPIPSWIKTEKFEIQAKLPANSPSYTTVQLWGQTPQLNLMLQVLLEDRFRVKVHHEMKELPVWALTVGKNGPKLKQAAPHEQTQTPDGRTVEIHGFQGLLPVPSQDGTRRNRITFQASSMQQVADSLAGFFDRPVVDRTGLKGEYDFAIEYDQDPDAPGQQLVMIHFRPTSGVTATALSAALQDVGLKLESTKAPVEVLVIDHVERPSDN